MVDPNKKDEFLEQLQEIPIVSVVAKRVGISKATIYRWRKEDQAFNKAVSKSLGFGRDSITDLAESKLIKAIQNDERWAIQTWLETHSAPYYKPRKPKVPGPPFKGIANIYVIPDKERVPAPIKSNPSP